MTLDDPTILSPWAGLRHGFVLPWRGARLVLRSPVLWGPAVAPVLLTLCLVIAAVWTAWSYAGLLTAVVPRPVGDGRFHALLGGLWWVWAVLSRLAVLALATLVGWFVGNLAASPFHDVLAERVERLCTPAASHPTSSAGEILRDVGWGLLHSVGALALYLACSCPLWLLDLIPGAGPPLHVGAALLLSSWWMAREVLDMPFSRRRYGFVDKLSILRDHAAVTTGLGLGTLLCVAVPVLNLLSMPAAVAGGTLLACELEGAGALPPSRRP